MIGYETIEQAVSYALVSTLGLKPQYRLVNPDGTYTHQDGIWWDDIHVMRDMQRSERQLGNECKVFRRFVTDSEEVPE